MGRLDESTSGELARGTDSLRRPASDTLWITDAELIRRSGIPEKIARETIKALDDNRLSGFPRKIKMWGDRRYWPAVKAFFDKCGYPQEQRRSA